MATPDYNEDEVLPQFYAQQGLRDPSPEELAEFGVPAAPLSAPSLRDPSPEELEEFGLSPAPSIPAAATPPQTQESANEKSKNDPLGLHATRAALEKEYHAIAALPTTDPRRARMETSFMDRWTEQQRQEQIADLSSRVTIWGAPAGQTLLHDQNSWVSGLRNVHEWMVRLGGVGQAGLQHITGDKAGFNETVRAVNDLKKLNRALDGDSALGKKYGPLFGEIAASLGQSTLATVATGGLNGVAGVMAIDDFNQKMVEAEDASLSPDDQWRYATRGAASTYGSMILFGALAKKAGVATGESVVPRLGKTGTDLLTMAGLGKTAVSASLEGAEEAVQQLVTSTQAASLGVNPDATDGLFDQLLKSFTTGAFVGSVAEFGQNIDGLSPKATYLKTTLNNWVGRIANKPKGDGAPSIEGTARTADAMGPDGTPVRRVDIDSDLDALAELKAEIDEQYARGPSPELQQSISERDALIQGITERTVDLDARSTKVFERDFETTTATARAQIESTASKIDSVKQEIFNLDKIVEDLEAGRSTKYTSPDTDVPLGQPSPLELRIANAQRRKAELSKNLRELSQEQVTTRGQLTEARRRAITERKPNEYDTRSKMLRQLGTEMRKRQVEERSVLDEWKVEFEQTYKDQSKHVEDEMARLAELDATSPRPPVLEPETPAKPGEPAKGPTETPLAVEPDAAPKRAPKSPTERARDAALGTRQRDLEVIRKKLGLDKLPPHEARTELWRYEQAAKQGLDSDESADTLTDKWLDGHIPSPVELAGVHLNTLDTIDLLDARANRLGQLDLNTKDGQIEFDYLNKVMDQAETRLEKITRANYLAGSAAGAALQARKAYLGTLYSMPRAEMIARRNKKADLTKADTEFLSKLTEDVNAKRKSLDATEKGTPEYDKADHDLATAQSNYKHGLENFKHKDWTSAGIDGLNALSNATTLTADFAPLGRQAAWDLARAPIRTIKNVGSFFDTLNVGKSIEDVRQNSFLINRAMKEHPMFNDLVKNGMPFMDPHTPFTAAEGSLLSRVREIFSRTPGYKYLSKLPIERFDLAFKTWANYHRFHMNVTEATIHADAIARGDMDLKDIVKVTNEFTGHTELPPGSTALLDRFLIAPRWTINRLVLPPKAAYWLARGSVDSIRGRSTGHTYQARQVLKVMAGASAWITGAMGTASMIYGPENVEFINDPDDPNFGTIRINNSYIDVTGGTRKSIQSIILAARGITAGHAKDDVPDALRVGGGFIGGRTSFAARAAGYAYQGGRPLFEKDPMSMAEFTTRNFTPFNGQDIIDTANKDGLSPAIRDGILSLWGIPVYNKSSKRKK